MVNIVSFVYPDLMEMQPQMLVVLYVNAMDMVMCKKRYVMIEMDIAIVFTIPWVDIVTNVNLDFMVNLSK